MYPVKRYVKILCAGLIAAMLVASLPPARVQAQSTPALGRNLNEIIAAAAREGSIDLTWSASVLGDADVARQHMEQFNKLYGLHLTYRFSAGQEMARQGTTLLTEFSAGQPASSDVLLSSAQSLSPLLPHEMFYIVPWAAISRDKLPSDITEAGGRIVRVGTSIPVVVYNTNLMPHPPVYGASNVGSGVARKACDAAQRIGIRRAVRDRFLGPAEGDRFRAKAGRAANRARPLR